MTNLIALAKTPAIALAVSVALCVADVARTDVGIGTEEPQARLHVVGESAQTGQDLRIEHLDPPEPAASLRLIVADPEGYFFAAEPEALGLSPGDGGDPPTAAEDDDWRASHTETPLTIDSAIYTNNRVGIGVTVPAYELDIEGDIRATGSLFASKHVITHATFATSDARFKRDIEDLEHGLEQVRAMQPKRFRYTQDSPVGGIDRVYYGLIAQDAAAIDPNLVQSFALPGLTETSIATEGPAAGADPVLTDYLGVDSQRLIFMLISAVKELDVKAREIDVLAARVDVLAARVKELDARVSESAHPSIDRNDPSCTLISRPPHPAPGRGVLTRFTTQLKPKEFF